MSGQARTSCLKKQPNNPTTQQPTNSDGQPNECEGMSGQARTSCLKKQPNNPATQQPSNPEGQTTKCPSRLTREGRQCRKNLENNNPTTQQPDGQEQVNVVESQNVHSQNPIGASGGLDSASLAGNGGLDTLGSQDG